jgi:ankyrin repeat protein
LAELVRFLVERGADVRARAWGEFFRSTNGFYGEFPLSFAVRANDRPIIHFFLARTKHNCGEPQTQTEPTQHTQPTQPTNQPKRNTQT